MRIGLLATLDGPLLPHMIDALLARGLSDLHVLTDGTSLSDRDRALWRARTDGALDPPGGHARRIARDARRIPFHAVENHNGPICKALIPKLGLDILVNAGTPRRLGPALLDSTPMGVLNVHPGILPAYRGCSAVEWSIHNNDPVGNTAHWMDDGYDTGPILAVAESRITDNARYTDIRVKVHRDGIHLLGNVLESLARGTLHPEDATVQLPDEGRSWPPMPDEIHEQVLERIRAGRYRPAT